MFKSRDGERSEGQGGLLRFVHFQNCVPQHWMSVRLKQFRHRGNTCVVRDLRGSTGAHRGAAG